MTALEPLEPSIDPALGALADAILIPPFPGTMAPPWVLEALSRGLAGVTLFGANVVGDTAALTAALRAAAPIEPVIAIDEEGGDVTRLAYASGSPYPGNAALGAVDDVSLTRSVYAAIGADLSRLGINTNLAPDADVLDLSGSAAVGTRSFGPDTSLVARHVAAAVAGLQSAGVVACAKHFPGHGSTGDDSHLSLATISGTLAEIRTRDLPPFVAAIAAGSTAIMPGHLLVPELTGSLPASLSPAAVTGLLRGELGFSGVVISDALEMKAASAIFGIPEAAALAVIAGVDLLCLGRDTDEEMYHAVRAALAGFMVVVQDARGRFASDGTWEPFRFDADDGYDTVEWAARLPGSNGRVGMFGLSYWGNTQWLTAIAQPPSLCAPCICRSPRYQPASRRSGGLMISGPHAVATSRENQMRAVYIACEVSRIFGMPSSRVQ